MKTVRRATRDEIPAILEIERQSPTAAHWSFEQYEKALSAGFPHREVLLVEDAGIMRGFLMARLVGRDSEIENIVVERGALRQGFGTLLLREFLRLAREEELELLSLEVRESNLPARALYEKFGFVDGGKRPRYYAHPDESAISYILLL